MAIFINPDWTGAESGTRIEPYAGLASMLTSEGSWAEDETYYIKADTTDNITGGFTINVPGVSILPYSDAGDGTYGEGARPIVSISGVDEDVFTFLIEAHGSVTKGIDIIGDSANTVTPPLARNVYYAATATDTGSEQHNALIEDCVSQLSGQHSIRAQCSSITIRNNIIIDSDTDNIFVWGGNDIIIEGNYIARSGAGGVQADGIQVVENPDPLANGDRNIIRENTISNVSGIKTCILGPGSNLNSLDCKINDNYCISDCVVALLIKGTGTIARRNTIIARGTGHQYIVGATLDKTISPEYSFTLVRDRTTVIDAIFNSIFFIYSATGKYNNNTIVSINKQDYLKGIRFNTLNASGNEARNNIFVGMYQGLAQHSGNLNSESNNLFFDTIMPIGLETEPPTLGWVNADGSTPSTLLNNDPMFIDADTGDFNLQEASPCVGAGIKWWGNGPRPTSKSGEPLPDTEIDLGAYQSTWSPNHPKNL